MIKIEKHEFPNIPVGTCIKWLKKDGKWSKEFYIAKCAHLVDGKSYWQVANDLLPEGKNKFSIYLFWDSIDKVYARFSHEYIRIVNIMQELSSQMNLIIRLINKNMQGSFLREFNKLWKPVEKKLQDMQVQQKQKSMDRIKTREKNVLSRSISIGRLKPVKEHGKIKFKRVKKSTGKKSAKTKSTKTKSAKTKLSKPPLRRVQSENNKKKKLSETIFDFNKL